MSLSKDLKFSSFYSPGLCILNGKTYVIPGYIEVPIGTLLEDVKSRWTQKLPNSGPGYGATNEEIDAYLAGNWKPEMVTTNSPDIRETVVSSRTGEEYDVARVNGEWNCTCKGFSFRRNCKHIKELKSNLSKTLLNCETK